MHPLLIGRDTLQDYEVEGTPWRSTANGVYSCGYASIPAGSQVEVETLDGTLQALTVAGRYQPDWHSPVFRAEFGLLLSNDLLQQISTPQTVMLFAELPAGQVDTASSVLGQTLSQTTVLNGAAYLAQFSQQYRNLYVFGIAMASLALLAGALQNKSPRPRRPSKNIFCEKNNIKWFFCAIDNVGTYSYTNNRP